MEELIPRCMAEALERGRERYNARFALGRHMHRGLGAGEFLDCLVRFAAPLVRAVHERDPARVDATLEALYDLVLDLLAADCLGPESRSPLVAEVWRKLLPAVPGLLAEAPRRLAASLSNAAHNLSNEPGANGGEWLAGMLALAPRCPDVETCLRAGQVLAWRSGLAHYRESALEVWRTLPEPLFYDAARLAKLRGRLSPEETLRAFEHPWPRLEEKGLQLALAAEVGGFRGFGGAFLQPPEVIASGGTLYAFDADCCWSIHADCFGATLKRFGPDLPDELGGDETFSFSKSGRVKWGKLAADFPFLAGAASFASTPDMLGVALPHSHKVFLVAVKGGGK